MNRTEQEDRAIDAILTRELLRRLSESDITVADIDAFMADKTPLSKEDFDILQHVDPFGKIREPQPKNVLNVFQFPDLAANVGDEPRLRAAARQQDAEITNPETLAALAEKRKEAIDRARQKRSPHNKSQE